MQAVRATDRPPSLKRTFYASVWRGVMRVSSWPRHRATRANSYDQSIRDRLSQLVAYQKLIIGRESNPMRAAIAHQNQTHRGFKASAAIRLRDIEVQRLSGRLWAFIEPDGTVVYPDVARQDISDTLDWITSERGALLTRGTVYWGGALACTPDHALNVRDDSDTEDCCKADFPFTQT